MEIARLATAGGIQAGERIFRLARFRETEATDVEMNRIAT